MTSLAVMLVTPLLMWVDYGWQPVAGSSGIEFMIRVGPQQLDSLSQGFDIRSDLPSGTMERVRSYRITTDPDELPNEGVPPRRSSASTTRPPTTALNANNNEFAIRLSREQIDTLRQGRDVLNYLPPGMETVTTYRITTEPNALGNNSSNNYRPTNSYSSSPNIYSSPTNNTPGRPYQNTLASSSQPVLDPITGQAVTNNFGQSNYGQSTLGGSNPYGQLNYGQNTTGNSSYTPNNPGTSTYLPTSNNPGGFNNTANNSSQGPLFPNSNSGNSNWNNSNTAWNTSGNNNGWNTNPTGFNNLNSGTFPSPAVNSGYQQNPSGYGNNFAAPNSFNGQTGPYAGTPVNYNQQARLDHAWNQPPSNYTNQPDYNLSPTAYRPGGASLAGVPQTRSVSPANWIAMLVALGLSLGANAYLGMLSMGLYNRCRVLLGQLRFSALQ